MCLLVRALGSSERGQALSLLGSIYACLLLHTGGWGQWVTTVKPRRGQWAGLALEEPVVGVVGAGGVGSRGVSGWRGRPGRAVLRPRGAQSRVNTLGCPIFLVRLQITHFTFLSPNFPVGLLILRRLL